MKLLKIIFSCDWEFFLQLGKKSPKLDWEWGLILAPETPEKKKSLNDSGAGIILSTNLKFYMTYVCNVSDLPHLLEQD